MKHLSLLSISGLLAVAACSDPPELPLTPAQQAVAASIESAPPYSLLVFSHETAENQGEGYALLCGPSLRPNSAVIAYGEMPCRENQYHTYGELARMGVVDVIPPTDPSYGATMAREARNQAERPAWLQQQNSLRR
jgi:hypothetical protein